MTFLVALLALSTPLSYRFPLERATVYDVSVEFDGTVPLFGGREAKVDVKMVVEAQGLTPDDEGNPRVVSEIKQLSLLMNGAELPFDTKNVLRFFPRTTISMDPRGKQLKTDAPDVKLPVRLPGLHPKRFPDITYLPIEFPEAGIDEGKAFRYDKSFGDSVVQFDVTPQKITDAAATLQISMRQSYEQLEDAYGNPVEKDGTVKVTTTVEGKGDAVFDRKRQIVSQMKVVAQATSKLQHLKKAETGERKLKTTLTVTARETP